MAAVVPKLLIGVPQGVAVLFQPRRIRLPLALAPLILGAFALDVDGVVQLPPGALGALEPEVLVVGVGGGAVVGQVDHLAVGAADHDPGDVALGHPLAGQFRTVGAVFLIPLMEAHGLGGHGGQGQHPVAPVDAQSLGHKSQLMGGIDFAVAVEEVPLAVVAVDVAVADLLPEVVLVSPGGVDQLPENPVANHVEKGQGLVVVALILQEHEFPAGVLHGMDQVPALLDGGGRADLDGRVLAAVHGVDGDADVGGPVGHDHHGVHVLPAVDLPVVGGAEAVLAPGLFHHLSAQLHPVRVDVADGGDFHVGHFQQGLRLAVSTPAEADDS